MKKIISLVLCLSGWATTSQAQTYEWANRAGSTGFDYPTNGTTDVNGNNYSVGVYAGTLMMGTATLLNSGSDDGYVAKYDANGALTWATRVYGSNIDRVLVSCLDGSGNLIVGGYYTGTSTAANASGGGTTAIGTASGGLDLFLVKFNSSGAVQWTKTYGGTGTDQPVGISADASDNIYVAGYFENQLKFNTSPATTLTSAGLLEAFTVKFNSSGTPQWAKKMGGAAEDVAVGVTTDVSSNVFVSGQYKGTASFDGTNKTSAGNYDVFLAKYDLAGALQWVKSYGGTADDVGGMVAIDNSGNIYQSGMLKSAPSTFDGVSTNGRGDYDGFIAKHNSSGTCQWVKSFGSTGADYSNYLMLDANQYPVAGGFFSGATLSLDNTGTTFSRVGGSDLYVTKYDNSGGYQWARTAGTSGNDATESLGKDSQHGIYTTGSYAGSLTLGSYSVGAYGAGDVFESKFALLETDPLSNDTIVVGDHPTVSFTANITFTGGNVFTAQLSDASGSFASPVYIGSTSGTSSGSITATIPSNTTPGTGYRIRVIASSPTEIGADNLSNLVIVPVLGIHCSTTHTPLGTTTDGKITATGTGGYIAYKYLWNNGKTTATITGLSMGNYTVTVTDGRGYSTSKQVEVAIAVEWEPSGGLSFATDGSYAVTKIFTANPIEDATSRNMSTVSDNEGISFKLENTTSGTYEVHLIEVPQTATPSEECEHVLDPAFVFDPEQYMGVEATQWVRHTVTVTNGTFAVFGGGTDYDIVNGDIIKIKRVGDGTVGAYHNGVLLDAEPLHYTSTIPASLVFGYSQSSPGATLSEPATGFTNNTDCIKTGDMLKNWVLTESFDWCGNKTGAQKVYMDNLGRTTQQMAESIADENVLVSQSIFDNFGRPTLQTLPAPSNQTALLYKDNFINDASGGAFNYLDFDKPISTGAAGEIENPNSAKNTVAGTVGWYYSDNNTYDAYQATTSYPYGRAELLGDPGAGLKRTATPGDEYRMGTGHENKGFEMITSGTELHVIFGDDLSYRVEMTEESDRLINSPIGIAGGKLTVLKSVSIDADGNEMIGYSSDGQTIATCRSGLENSCIAQYAQEIMQYQGTACVDIHLPAAKKSTLALPLPTGPTNATNADISYTITDLHKQKLLVSGTDYSLNTSTRAVTFLGAYASGTSLLRISFAYTGGYLANYTANPDSIPDAKVTYQLDYNKWTVNFYDLAGNLRKAVSPKGFDCTAEAGGTLTNFSTYDYNSLDQLIATKSPDEGMVEMTYDSEGNIRFAQNELQKASDKFSYISYDRFGRPYESGEYTPSGSALVYFQNFYESAATASGCGGSCISSNTILDEVDGLHSSGCTDQNFITYYLPASADEIPSGYTYKSQYPQTHLLGGIGKTSNANTSTWYSYDVMGRPRFSVQQLTDADFVSAYGTLSDRIKTQQFEYDSCTGALTKQTYQKNVSGEVLAHFYAYDPNQRLRFVKTARSASTVYSAADPQATYFYTILGALRREELGDRLQGIDYIYTVNGQLKSINHPSLSASLDPGHDGAGGSCALDLFGMALDYHSNDYSRTSSNVYTTSSSGTHTGLIDAMRYKVRDYVYGSSNDANKIVGTPTTTLYTSTNSATNEQLMNKYSYDEMDQLSILSFGVYNSTTPAFTARDDYKEYGHSAVAGINYDANGNILDLIRNGYGGTGTPGLEMDNLSYTIGSGNNKLTAILDGSTSTYTTDFDAATSKSFTYNSIGQLTASAAESIGTNGITYYPDGKIKSVSYTSPSGSSTQYSYDAQGHKCKVKYNNGSTTHITWYANDPTGRVLAIYEKAGAAAAAITEEPIYGAGHIGNFMFGGTPHVEYQLCDHLGNVRVTFKAGSGGSPVVLTNWRDYYAFGGIRVGRNYTSADACRYSYGGNERDGGPNKWSNFDLRMLNVDLGRWMTPDPYGQFYSPYLAMANNPVSNIDPTGGVVNSIKGINPHAASDAYNLEKANARKFYIFGRDLVDGTGVKIYTEEQMEAFSKNPLNAGAMKVFKFTHVEELSKFSAAQRLQFAVSLQDKINLRRARMLPKGDESPAKAYNPMDNYISSFTKVHTSTSTTTETITRGPTTINPNTTVTTITTVTTTNTFSTGYCLPSLSRTKMDFVSSSGVLSGINFDKEMQENINKSELQAGAGGYHLGENFSRNSNRYTENRQKNSEFLPGGGRNTSGQGRGWIEPTNKSIGGVGVLAGAVENLSGNTTIGTNRRFYSGWGGNQYVSTAKLTKIGKGLGATTLIAGTLIDVIGVRNYYKYGANSSNAVNPGKAGLNLSIGGWSLLNPATAVGGALFYGIDSFYPGGFQGAMGRSSEVQRRDRGMLGVYPKD